MPCETCHLNGLPSFTLAPRMVIYEDQHWRVEHAHYGEILGWTMIVPRRHMLSMDELSETELAELATLTERITQALPKLTGFPDVRIIYGCERPGVDHLQIHLIPQPEMPDEAKPSAAELFALWKRPESEWASTQLQDSLALELGTLVSG